MWRRPRIASTTSCNCAQLQDETGGFQAFVPWPFIRENTRLAASAQGLAAWIELRTVAVSRLMLDNFAHIKAYWVSLGVGTAQAALGYGADDLDGTVRHERIHHDAGARSPEVLHGRARLRGLGAAPRPAASRSSAIRSIAASRRWEKLANAGNGEVVATSDRLRGMAPLASGQSRKTERHRGRIPTATLRE